MATFELHAAPGTIPSVQTRLACIGQLIVPHESDADPHATSHRHDDAHSTLPQAGPAEPEPLLDPSPVHVTLHAPRPQSTAPHALSPVHVTVHAAAAVHETCGHVPAAVHVIAQLQPAGHATLLPAPCIMQVRVERSHALHSAGHTAASIDGASGVPTMQ